MLTDRPSAARIASVFRDEIGKYLSETVIVNHQPGKQRLLQALSLVERSGSGL